MKVGDIVIKRTTLHRLQFYEHIDDQTLIDNGISLESLDQRVGLIVDNYLTPRICKYVSVHWSDGVFQVKTRARSLEIINEDFDIPPKKEIT